jgi:hypothetical protein
VTPSTNTAVTWQVNGENGGDAIIGTVSTAGLYTAPTVLPSTTTVAVTAISQADTTKTASATVTLTAPTVTISISPKTATVAAGGSVQFTPTVTSTDNNTAVSWSVNGCAVSATCGSVSSTGLYTAPLSPPKESITVTATSKSNATFTASAPITVQFGNGSLNGQYVFLVTQPDNSSGSGFAFRGGTFQADGAGHIANGLSDSNSASGPSPIGGVAFTGTYLVGIDGRGTATINDAAGTHKFSFALTSSTRGQLIEFDSAGVTSGFIRQQDPTAIATVSGSFVFSLFGDNTGPFAAVGQMSFTSPNISGTEDANNRGTVSQVGIVGSYTVGTSGRGIATVTGVVGTSQFAFYIIDASTLILIDIDSSGARAAGTAYAQSPGPFNNGSLVSSVYFASGDTVSGIKPYGQAGRFGTDGAGNFTGAVFDVNNAGALTTSASFSGASYNMAATGRGTISTGTSNFIFWLASSKQGVVMQNDSAIVATGLLLQQPSQIPSVTGGFEFVVAGASADGATPQAIEGQVTASGFSSSGTQDANTGGNTQSAALGSGITLTTGANGRGTVSISSLSYAFYFVTPDRFVLLSATPGSPVLSGVAERQCSDCQF